MNIRINLYNSISKLPLETFKMIYILLFYIFCSNLFIYNFELNGKIQILNTSLIFILLLIDKFNFSDKFIFLNFLFFFIGIIDDIIFYRIIGITSIYYIILFNIFISLYKNFNEKRLFLFIISSFLLFLNYIYFIFTYLIYIFFDITVYNFSYDSSIEINSIIFNSIYSIFFNFLLLILYIFVFRKSIKYNII